MAMIDISVIEREAAFAEEMKKRALKAEQALADLRAAALAVLNLVVEGCAVCGRNATVVDGIGDPLCDEHVGQADGVVQDGDNAAELRRLRALLAG